MEPKLGEDIAESWVGIKTSIIPSINLALQQNAFPVIREILIQNDTSEQYSEIELTVRSSPSFLVERTWPIDRLAPETQLIIDDCHIELRNSYLRTITESLEGKIVFTLKKEDTVLAEVATQVRLLCKDEWGGTSCIPEIIAAFIQPNDPAVQGVLRDASKKLEASGELKSLEGYQSNSPQRVAIIASSIWSAVCKLDLTYATPPASFEKNGQKVRLPSKIMETRLATCLDTVLLFTSCLEQAGLNSLVIFTENHTLVGLWLVDEDFSSTIIYEAQSLRKRIQLKELIVFDAMLSTNNPPTPFSLSVGKGRDLLDLDEKFRLAVDVKRARLSSIKPLSDRELVGDYKANLKVCDIEVAIDIPGNLPDQSYSYTSVKPVVHDSPEARVENWKRQLLDLTMKNRLLNFTGKARSIRLECYHPEKLEDLLADGNKFKIISSDELNLDDVQRSEQVHLQQQHENLRENRVNKLLNKKELVTNQDTKKLQANLLALYRQARTAIQEGNTNILYISIGLLNWQQPNQPKRIYKAPLILIPVELTRKSVNSGFRLQLHEDEPIFNPTLLEMLKQDFGLEITELTGELPVDKYGLDVSHIWNVVRREVRDIPGWEVEETAIISIFSFSKHLMWMDLCNRVDVLKKNKLVKHLIENPRDNYSGGADNPFPKVETLDQERHPKNSFIPLLADSSQMAAIYAAESGKDFVLIGPPGTGKSQTITNMISQLLAVGKTVLFVSEKTSALEVVYKRLQQVGIGEHCLELHSSKAKKSEVIRQLGCAWDVKTSSAKNWERESERLSKLHEDLNKYVKQLHQAYPNGLTPYQAMGMILKYSGIPKIDLQWVRFDEHNLKSFETLKEVSKRIDVNTAELDGIDNSPLAEVSAADWSPSWQSSFVMLGSKIKQHMEKLQQAHEEYMRALNINIPILSYHQLSAVKDMAAQLPEAFAESFYFGLSSQGATHRKELVEVIELVKQFNGVLKKLSSHFKQEVFDLPLEDFEVQWLSSEKKWFLSKWLKQRKILKSLREKSVENQINKDILGDIECLIVAKKLKIKIEKYNHLSNIVGKHWDGVNSNIQWMEKACGWLDGILNSIVNMTVNQEEFLSVKKRIALLVEEQNELLQTNSPIVSKGEFFIEQFNIYEKMLTELSSIIAHPDLDIFTAKADSCYYQEVNSVCDRWLSSENKLRCWCAWRKVRQEAIDIGLSPRIDAIERGDAHRISATDLLLANYSRWWVNAVVDHDEVLRNFIVAEHREKIQEFHGLSEDFMELTQRQVKVKLSKSIPKKTNVDKKSAWGILSRELQKKTQHMPLRQLISKMSGALTQLTPCVMMSPMSIAQYLPPDGKPFDVVIFDEASQITVCDAIGAIARAKQAIIIGDPKQLPPTSFFGRGSDNDFDLDEDCEDDLESILDECLAARIPQMKLNWHYRSKCESLITFSNHHYYNDSLITFPNTDTMGMSVYFHSVDSVYKRKSRVNRGEADAIVNDIVAKLRSPGFNKSIGVVTFNMSQQTLISNLFEKAREKYPEIEPHFDEEKFDAVFVKNIESVQGDECDIIYFSITFGKDAAGKLSMNFGAMNKSGGTRRLNVAITRAKEEMHVFSSLKPGDIDLSRTASEGVRDLKHFLEYAQRGAKALVEEFDAPGGYFDSPFEQAVAEHLQSKGWTVHSQIGVSGFKIDLGVVNPDAPGQYLSAVECDGATYHRSATARDRDFLREQVLRGLGWEVIRIWSTDWWINSQLATEHIHNQLSGILEQYRIDSRTEEGEISINGHGSK